MRYFYIGESLKYLWKTINLLFIVDFHIKELNLFDCDLIVASGYWQCARSSGAASASCFASHLEIYGPIVQGIEGRRVVASVDTGLLIDTGEVGANLFAGDDSAGYGAVIAEFNWQYVAGGDGG